VLLEPRFSFGFLKNPSTIGLVLVVQHPPYLNEEGSPYGISIGFSSRDLYSVYWCIDLFDKVVEFPWRDEFFFL
jgi:hypothetical protein